MKKKVDRVAMFLLVKAEIAIAMASPYFPLPLSSTFPGHGKHAPSPQQPAHRTQKSQSIATSQPSRLVGLLATEPARRQTGPATNQQAAF